MTENSNEFNFTYTAPTENERREIEHIRRQYETKVEGESKSARIKRLHSIIINRASIASLVMGILGTLIFGLGLTMVLEWSMYVLGLILGLVGARPIALAYPTYRFVFNHGKQKYGEEILLLSRQLLGEE